jgi:hypothetical protein
MMSADDPPRLPKWAFLLGDGTLLATAAWIAGKASHPTAGGALIAIVSCVALAAVCGAIPFLADYARQQEASLVERQRALSALAQTVETCAEQISIAAASLQRFSELAVSRAQQAKETVQPVPSQIAELQSQLAQAREGERAKLAPLEAAVAAAAAAVERMGAGVTTRIDSASALLEAKVAAVAGAVAALRTAAPSPPEAPHAGGSPIAKVVPFENPAPPPVIAFTAPPAPAPAAAELKEVPSPAAEPEPEVAAHRPADPSNPESSAIPPAEINPAPAEAPAPPPPRKRAARKPPATAPLPLELPAEAAPTPAPLDPGDSAPPDGESALSADGATRLLVTAYIGIGNRLFIRGEGPGLSWERGVPLQFVSIGKWRWETAEASAPVVFRLYKNDEIECTALGRRYLTPGRQQEFQATF